ncbi:hypothetical protein LZC95_09780 [Pendulispora brunnea]|uniref:Outer membrane protein beta-barrel domain-containing protein n=1 Tax=Pendulispora brunnea TaxID=2905690 RepID=A0ABZ2KEK3_9BACT
MKSTFASASVLAFLCLATPARAERAGFRGEDTSYGRIEGDLSFVFGLGATFGPRAPRGAVDVRLRYLDTIGMFATYEEGFGGAAEPRRVLATGVELRPLFIARWLQGRELDSPRLDLAIDSFGLELGAFFAHPVGDTFGSRRGLQAGLGLELPILAQANGPWIGLHGGVRWSDDALGGAPLRGPSDRAAYFTVTLAWHAIFGAHVVDMQDRRPER